MENYDDLARFIQNTGAILDKPIVFFDLETTGLDIMTDRIVEISAIKINPDYSIEDLYYRINPGKHIPEEATAVHGITDEDVKESPMFATVGEGIFRFFDGCDYGGFNIKRFDLPMLIEEFNRIGKGLKYSRSKIVDGFAIYSAMEPRDLEHSLEYYTGEKMEHAHSAQDDNVASIKIAFKQYERYNFENMFDLHNNSVGRMLDLRGFFTRNEKDNTIIFATGKHRNESVLEVANSDPGYIGWVRKNTCIDTQRHLEAILGGKEK